MDITKTVSGGFQTTKGTVIELRTKFDNAGVAVSSVAVLDLFKDATAQAEGCVCDSQGVTITDMSGYDGTVAWAEGKLPDSLDPIEE